MSELTVSLPQHLRDTLITVQDHVPLDLRTLILDTLQDTTERAEIAYSLLSDISKWASSDQGKTVLEKNDIAPSDYLLIALLSGTKTSPRSRLPPPIPVPEPWEVAIEEKSQRRAIAALVNGFFSVIGVGFAVWWGSKNTGWSDEQRVLLAFAVAIVVGAAEAGLWIIWSSRREASKIYRREARERKAQRLLEKFEAISEKSKHDSTLVPESSSAPLDQDAGTLRHRPHAGISGVTCEES